MQIEIRTEDDIVTSRSVAKTIAKEIGFGLVDQTKIATAISELTRNIIKYAKEGIMAIVTLKDLQRTGIEIILEDKGSGIPDIEQAMQEGYTTGQGLGMGLAGAKNLMDEFEVESTPGQGTRVVVRKWL